MRKMNYRKLLGRIREYGYTQKAVAMAIKISEGQLNQKLKGAYAFTQTEIMNLCEALDIPPEAISEYFFSPEN